MITQHTISQPAIDILKKIKEATRPHHDRIEQNVWTKGIINNTISKEGYIRLLGKFYGFYVVCEEKIQDSIYWQQQNFAIEARKKIPLLEQDLVCFGYTRNQIKSLEVCTDIPTLDHIAQFLGFLYVVEGSTLGGQVLSRQLQKKFTFTSHKGACYFNSYGKENLKEMWMAFRAVLLKYVKENPAQEKEIIYTAQMTFDKLTAWLEK